MPKYAYQTQVELELVNCCDCGTTFGIEATMHKEKLRGHGKTFYCPNGHPQSYTDSEIGRLKTQLAQETKNREVVETQLRETKRVVTRKEEEIKYEQRRVAAQKGLHTRTKNKIANGICPCCDIFFPDLHEHMSEAHPDYEHTDELEGNETGMTART